MHIAVRMPRAYVRTTNPQLLLAITLSQPQRADTCIVPCINTE